MDRFITIDEPNITAFNKKLNELAKQGYEPIGSITKDGEWLFVIVEKKIVKVPLKYEIKKKEEEIPKSSGKGSEVTVMSGERE